MIGRASGIGAGGMTRDSLNCLLRKAIDSCRASPRQNPTILSNQSDSYKWLRKSAQIATMMLWNGDLRKSSLFPAKQKTMWQFAENNPLEGVQNLVFVQRHHNERSVFCFPLPLAKIAIF